MKVTYNPPKGDEDLVSVFGRVFEGGKAVDIDDEKMLEKLKGNPHFQVGNHKAAEVENKTDDDKRLEKVLDGRSKEAREARAQAAEADADAESKERALKQAQALAEARASKEKD